MLKLINGHGLNTERIFRGETMALNLSERDSTASVTVAANAGSFTTGNWVQDLEDPGSGIVWRIKTVDDQRDSGSRTLSLEHLINTLKDRIIPDEITTEDISGSSSSATARAAINKVLSYQSDWELGTFDYDAVSNPYHFDGETLKSALETISGSLEDPVWGYDFSSYPFKLHIRHLGGDADSELRGGRNLTTIKITEDRSQMYTRFYPRGKNNLKLSGTEYIEKNVDRYGLVEKTETDSAKETEAELISWANDRLNRHARPGHTVTISGLEMSASTGEDLDHLVIGHKCRVPLPDDGETVIEKITKLSWKDKIKDPQGVTITLADALEDVASIVKSESSKSSSGSRSAAKADEANELLIGTVEQGLYSVIAQTSTNIYMHVHDEIQGVMSTIEQTACSIMLSVSTTKSDLYSCIMTTATSITLTVASAKSDMFSKIEQTASSIRLEVNSSKSTIFSTIMQTATNIYTQVGNAKSDTYSKIEQTASSIRSEVNSSKSTIFSSIMQTATNIYTQVGNAKSDTYSKIEQTASSIRSEVNTAKSSLWSSIVQTSTQISLKVGKGEVISSINQSAEAITISASKINLEGYVTTSMLTGDFICSKISASNSLTVNSILANSINVVIGNTTSPVATQTYVEGCVWDLQITSSGNTYTLQKKALGPNAATWVDVGSFSRAVSSWTGTWSGRKLKVSVSPQGQHKNYYLYSTLVKSGTASHTTSDGNHYATQTIKVYSDDDGTDTDAGTELLSQSVSILANDVYSAGYAVSNSQISMDTFSWVPTSAGQTAVDGRKNMGTLTRQSVSSYLLFSIKVHGHTALCYLTLN
jgi:phage minor structural protein